MACIKFNRWRKNQSVRCYSWDKLTFEGNNSANMAVWFGVLMSKCVETHSQTTEMCGDDVTRAQPVRNKYRAPENGPTDMHEGDDRPCRNLVHREQMSRQKEWQDWLCKTGKWQSETCAPIKLSVGTGNNIRAHPVATAAGRARFLP